MAVELSKLNLPKSIDDSGIEIAQWSGAVNFLFVEDTLAMIRRSDTMPSHKGQIGFMGGHKNQGEKEPLVTAAREFEEESGLSRELIYYHGIHQPVMTSRQKVIVPVIGEFQESKSYFLENVVSNGEWDNAILVDIASLKNQDYWCKANLKMDEDFDIYFFPLIEKFCQYKISDPNAPYTLWGASAKMIVNFFKNSL